MLLCLWVFCTHKHTAWACHHFVCALVTPFTTICSLYSIGINRINMTLSHKNIFMESFVLPHTRLLVRSFTVCHTDIFLLFFSSKNGLRFKGRNVCMHIIWLSVNDKFITILRTWTSIQRLHTSFDPIHYPRCGVRCQSRERFHIHKTRGPKSIRLRYNFVR